MMGHKICFNGEIWIIIPKLSFLTGALAHYEHSHLDLSCLKYFFFFFFVLPVFT